MFLYANRFHTVSSHLELSLTILLSSWFWILYAKGAERCPECAKLVGEIFCFEIDTVDTTVSMKQSDLLFHLAETRLNVKSDGEDIMSPYIHDQLWTATEPVRHPAFWFRLRSGWFRAVSTGSPCCATGRMTPPLHSAWYENLMDEGQTTLEGVRIAFRDISFHSSRYLNNISHL
jgi:hypothetical protein